MIEERVKGEEEKEKELSGLDKASLYSNFVFYILSHYDGWKQRLLEALKAMLLLHPAAFACGCSSYHCL
jgi:hypothetical protein